VQPKLIVESEEDRVAPLSMGSLPLPLPAAYRGTVLVPSGSENPEGRVEAPGALIRAYAFMGVEGIVENADEALSVVQVAEGRAREDGSYELLVPGELRSSSLPR
jgi:hypothetical protein